MQQIIVMRDTIVQMAPLLGISFPVHLEHMATELALLCQMNV